jgi:hypothetical protein
MDTIVKYEIDKFGVIHQLNPEPFIYDTEYIDGSYGNIRPLTEQMAYLRLGYIIGVLGKIPCSVLDVGYGDGAFLKVCAASNIDSYGTDLFDNYIPDKCKFVKESTDRFYDVITFFDSLEHFPDINFVRDLQCNYVVVSLPWCHNYDEEWFMNWKHRKPNEHIHHFNIRSLQNFMEDCGFSRIGFSNVEDTIRKSTKNNYGSNILTAVFERTK